MSKSTISTFQLFEIFPDEQTAREYLEDRSGPICPACKSGERITKRTGGYYRCNACPEVSVGHNFTVRTNTIFERSHIPLHKWVYAMYLLVTARKGISSMQLAKEIGVTQKSAWFMLQRLREACSTPDNQDKLRGVIDLESKPHPEAGEQEMKTYAKYSTERTHAIVTNSGIRFISANDAFGIAQSTVVKIHTFFAVLGGGADPAVMPAAQLGEHIVHGGSKRVFRLHRFGRYYILRTDMYGDGSWHFQITSPETYDALIERCRTDKRWKASE